MSSVVTLPIFAPVTNYYDHVSVNYGWDSVKKSLNVSVLTLPKGNIDDKVSYLEVTVTYNKVIPGRPLEKVKKTVRSDEKTYSFSKILNEAELFDGLVKAGSYLEILNTEIRTYATNEYKEPIFYFYNPDNGKDNKYGAHCVLEGTKVLTKSGYVTIETLQPGDKVITHNGAEKSIIKKATWTLEYENNLTNNDGRVFKIERGYAGAKETVFVSYHHKVFMHYKQFVKAGHAKLPEATKEEIAPTGLYRLYNIQVEDHTRNHLVVGGGLVIESWDGKLDSKAKPAIGR
jgi:hypothetical protein